MRHSIYLLIYFPCPAKKEPRTFRKGKTRKVTAQTSCLSPSKSAGNSVKPPIGAGLGHLTCDPLRLVELNCVQSQSEPFSALPLTRKRCPALIGLTTLQHPRRSSSGGWRLIKWRLFKTDPRELRLETSARLRCRGRPNKKCCKCKNSLCIISSPFMTFGLFGFFFLQA